MRPRSITLARAAIGVTLALLSVSARVLAAPESAAVADLDAAPGLRDEAAATSLLLRSMLHPATRLAVTRRELALALDATAGATLREAVTVEPGLAPHVLSKLGATRLFFGTITRTGDRLVASGQVLGPEGTVAEIQAMAPVGDVGVLARGLARQLAARLGLAFKEVPPTSLAPLRPYLAAASALARRDGVGAARALETAGARAGRIDAAREIALAVARDTKLGADARAHAALLAGDAKLALDVADRALATEPHDVAVRAAKARALVALQDLPRAAKELAESEREPAAAKDPTVAAARIELALARGDAAGKRDQAFAPILDHAPATWQKALPVLAEAPPHSFGPRVESAAIGAAAGLAREAPGLASMVAVRAVEGGNDLPRALPLIRVGEHRTDELTRAKESADAAGAGSTAAGAALARELEGRAKAAREIKLSQLGADHGDLQPAIDALAPLLARFDRLGAGSLTRALLVGRKGNASFALAPVRTRPSRLRDALEAALAGAPYEIEVLLGGHTMGVGEELPDSQLSEDALGSLAARANADAVVLYRIRGDGRSAAVELIVFDVAAGKAFVGDATIPGTPAGFVGWNLAALALYAGLAAVALVFVLARVLRGTVVVRLRSELGGAEELLCLRLTRTATPQTVDHPAEMAARLRRARPQRSRFEITHVGREAKLPKIPLGTWHVHLTGVYQRAGQEVRTISGEAYTRQIHVSPARTVEVTFTVEPANADFMVTVVDDDAPVAGAKVYVDDDVRAVVYTQKNGAAMLPVSKGLRVIHVEARGLHVQRPYEVIKHKLHELQVNLSWERRVDAVSRVLETHDGSEVPPAASPAAARVAVGARAPIEIPSALPTPAANDIRLADVAPAAAPTGLSRYERQAELGRGAMGVVYRAIDRVLERDVAIKIMSPEIKQNPELAARFFQEARALAALNHPNIVTIYDQGDDAGELFLVMELVEGSTLAGLLEQHAGPLPLEHALELVDQLCAGMGYAHARRIIHRDIKPANLFVTFGGQLKIGDFGLARAIAAMQIQQTRIQGTPLYMSPEQIQGRDIDFRADLYAIGCTLFELLTGRPPFIEGEILYHHLHTPPQRPSDLVPGLPPALDEVVLACLAKDKAARLPSAESIRQTLRSAHG